MGENMQSPELTRRSMLAHLTVAASLSVPSVAHGAKSRQIFKPGQVWLDTAGRPIQAHGGSILQVGDTFYWYGENKERTVPGSRIWHWGVRAYASKDLYNWSDAGLIIPPVMDPASPLNPESNLDRPHIIFNQQTRKFVCWIKIMEKDGRQTRTVLTADRLTGPYTIVRTGLQPLGMSAGDFDLVVSPDDGKAYMYFERVHTELICADLTPDYTDVTGFYSTHYPRVAPPMVREAPAYFLRDGKHYLVTSGTTGYHPNPSEVAIADTYHGPWNVLGDAHPSDISRTSFNSQVTSVFKHPGKKDLYIALADRWISNLEEIEGSAFGSGAAYRQWADIFTKWFDKRQPALNPQEKATANAESGRVNTSRATYVWLPIYFDGGRPTIIWHDEWSLDDFEDA